MNPMSPAEAAARPGEHWEATPCRAPDLLVAHRWGEDTFAYVKPMLEALGIRAHFETRAAAEASAKRNGTDAMGMNFVKERERNERIAADRFRHENKQAIGSSMCMKKG